MKTHIIPASLNILATRSIPAPRARITLIDRRNAESPSVSLIWDDATLRVEDFDLAALGEVESSQSDLLACPPRGWVTLRGGCHLRVGSSIKRLPRKRLAK
jgi:hypothetical protein